MDSPYPLLSDPTAWMDYPLDTKLLLKGRFSGHTHPGDTEVSFIFTDLEVITILITDPGGLPKDFPSSPSHFPFPVTLVATVSDNGLEASSKDIIITVFIKEKVP